MEEVQTEKGKEFNNLLNSKINRAALTHLGFLRHMDRCVPSPAHRAPYLEGD